MVSNPAVNLTLDYIEALKSGLRITQPPGGPPLFDPAAACDIGVLGDRLRALMALQGADAIRAVEERQGAMLQMVAYGLMDDFETCVKIGFLLGDRVVLWDLLGGRILEQVPSAIDRERVGCIATNIVALEPLARSGHVVILPHPFDWHEGARQAVAQLEAETGCPPSAKLLGLTASLAVAARLRLNPYTIAEDDDEFDALIGAVKDDRGTPQHLYRSTVSALLTQHLVSQPRFNEFLKLPSTAFLEVLEDREDFYRQLRDRLGEFDGAQDYRIDVLAREIEKRLEDRNDTVREFAEYWDMYGSVLSGAISLLMLAGGAGALPTALPVAITTAMKAAKLVTAKKGEGSLIAAVFRELSSERAKQEFLAGRNVESRHHAMMAMTPCLARAVVNHLTDDEIHETINCRDTWHDYCCDYLGDLWKISPAAFWQHIRIAAEHEEGIVIGDFDYHWDVLRSSQVPDETWRAMLQSICHQQSPVPEFLQKSVIAQTDWGGEHGEHMRSLLLDWHQGLNGAEKETATRFLREAYDGSLPSWFSPAADAGD